MLCIRFTRRKGPRGTRRAAAVKQNTMRTPRMGAKSTRRTLWVELFSLAAGYAVNSATRLHRGVRTASISLNPGSLPRCQAMMVASSGTLSEKVSGKQLILFSEVITFSLQHHTVISNLAPVPRREISGKPSGWQ